MPRKTHSQCWSQLCARPSIAAVAPTCADHPAGILKDVVRLPIGADPMSVRDHLLALAAECEAETVAGSYWMAFLRTVRDSGRWGLEAARWMAAASSRTRAASREE